MLYCIVCFSSTTFALVPLIIGRQPVELCVFFLATCHWHVHIGYVYLLANKLIDWLIIEIVGETLSKLVNTIYKRAQWSAKPNLKSYWRHGKHLGLGRLLSCRLCCYVVWVLGHKISYSGKFRLKLLKSGLENFDNFLFFVTFIEIWIRFISQYTVDRLAAVTGSAGVH